MTTDEMIETLQYLLGNIGSVMDAHILLELKLAQVKAERGPELPWRLITSISGTTVADTAEIALPSGFLREVEDDGLFLTVSGSKILLRKKDLDVLLRDYSTGAIPKYYAIMGTDFHIYPISSEALPYTFRYYAKEPVLAVGDSGNQWSLYYPDLLMGLAGQSLCVSYRAVEIKPRFDEMVSIAWRQINVDNTAREMANKEGSYGGG